MESKRKLSSFTLSKEATKKLELISQQEGLNKSRLIEGLINDYKLEREIMYVKSVDSPCGPIAIPLDEIAVKVAKILNKNE